MLYIARASRIAVARDLKNTIRIWRLNPGSTFVAYAALSVGISATITIFTVVSGLLIRPLPIPDSGLVVRILSIDRHDGQSPLSLPDALDIKHRVHSTQSFACYRDLNGNLKYGSQTAMVHVLEIDADLFDVMGKKVAQGHAFGPQANQPGAACEAVLSWSLWKSHFNGAPVSGHVIRLNEKPCLVDGVLPEDLNLPLETDIWVPKPFDLRSPMNGRGARAVQGLARLKRSESVAELNSELSSISSQLRNENPATDAALRLQAVPLQDWLSKDVKPSILILFAAVTSVLLMACVNVANLLLARASARSREISVRMALGASRVGVMQQLLTESILLAFVSSASGLLLSILSVRWIRSLPNLALLRPETIQIDWRVILFAIVAAGATGLLFGTAPALRLCVGSLAAILNQASGRITETKRQQVTRKFLVGGETAIATLLLISSLLVLRSFAEVSKINVGFRTDHLLTAYVSLNPGRYGNDTNDLARLARNVLQDLRSRAGIEAATFTTSLPLQATSVVGPIQVQGRPIPVNWSDTPSVLYTGVSPLFSKTFDIPLKAGVDLDDRDDRDDATAILVNATFAKTFFPGESAVGKRIRISPALNPYVPWQEIVGVIGDTRQASVEAPVRPELFSPLSRSISMYPAIAIRTKDDPLLHVHDIESALHKQDSELPIFYPRTMDDIKARRLGARRFNTMLLTGFAFVALLLSSGGIFAIISYSVSIRTPEIGVRMACGATQQHILRMIIVEGMLPAFGGIAAGLLAAVIVTRYLASLLYGVTETDVVSYLSTVLLLVLFSVAAAWLPARRALLTEPWRALRHE